MLIYQDPDFKLQPVRVSDIEYERAMRAFVILCADVVFVNRELCLIYLAERIVEPVKGLWWIGGRVLRGETFETAAVRKIHEECGIKISEDRLKFIEIIRHMSAVRKQHPQNIGADTMTFTYYVEIQPDEIVAANLALSPTEYTPASLLPYDVSRIKEVGVRQQVLDICSRIFSQ